MRLFKQTILAGVVMTLLLGCKKYQEGPILSLKTKSGRVINKWKIEQGDTLYWGLTPIYSMEFKKNGDYILEVPKDSVNSLYINGTWQFIDKKENIRLRLPQFNYRRFILVEKIDTIQILRLKEKEFWYANKNQNTELHLQPY